MENEEKRDKELQSLKLVVASYSVIFILKISIYFATGVMVILAESLHTLSDIFISIFLLIAFIWSKRKADEDYMFGYGRAQNIAALVAAILFVSFTGFELYKEAISHLFNLHKEIIYQNLSWAVAVILVSMAIAFAPMINLLRHKRKGAASKAQLSELFNDQLGLLAALAGTIFIVLGKPIADPIATIIVATVIVVNAIKLFIENSRLLLGKSPGSQFSKHVEELALSIPGVAGFHDLKAEYIGPDRIHAGFHIEVSRDLSVEEGHAICKEVENKVYEHTACQSCTIPISIRNKFSYIQELG